MRAKAEFWPLCLLCLTILTSLYGAPNCQALTFEENRPHSHTLDDMRFSSDGKQVVSAAEAQIKIWDTQSRRLTHIERPSWDGRIALTADGKRAVGVNSSGAATVVDVWGPIDKPYATIQIGDRASIIGPTPNSDRVLVSYYPRHSEMELYAIFDLNTGRKIADQIKPPKNSTFHQFHSDGSMYIASEHSRVHLVETQTGRIIRTFQAYRARITALALSPDGSILITSGPEGRDMKLKGFDVKTGKLRFSDDHYGDVDAFAFSADGQFFAQSNVENGDDIIKIRKASNADIVKRLKLPIGRCQSLTFSPDGRLLAAGNDKGGITLWDVTEGRLIGDVGTKYRTTEAIAVSQTENRLVTGDSSGGVFAWEVSSGRLSQDLGAHASRVDTIAVAPDGSLTASGAADGTIRLVDNATGKLLRGSNAHGDGVLTVAFSSDGRRIVTGGLDRSVKVWELGRKDASTFLGSRGPPRSVAFSRNDQQIIAVGSSPQNDGADDSITRTWDIRSGKVLAQTGKANGDRRLATLASTSGGLRLISYDDQESASHPLSIKDPLDGKVLSKYAIEDNPSTARLSSDGKLLLATSVFGSIQVWDTTSEKLKGKWLVRDCGTVIDASFVAGGSVVAAACERSKSLKFMRSEDGGLLATRLMDDAGEWVIYTPEGFYDASDNGAQMVSVFEGRRFFSLDQLSQTLYRPDFVREKLKGDTVAKVREAASRLSATDVVGAGAAPKVSITSPADKITIQKDKISVDVTLEVFEGGLGRIEWRVNGVVIGLDERGLSPSTEINNASSDILSTEKVTRILDLDEGDNRVEIVAYNRSGLVASLPSSITVNVNDVVSRSRPKLFALTVGINDYFDGRLKLAYSVPDAKAVASAIKKSSLAIYDEGEVVTLADAEVTVAKLDETFERLSKKVGPKDIFVLFVAGHGKTIGGRFYFLPYDFKYVDERSFDRAISQGKIQSWMARIAAKKSLLLFDACESGSLTEDGAGQRGLERIVATDKLTKLMGRTVLTASTDVAPAMEGYRGHGVFTYALLDAIEHADVDAEGRINVVELASYLDRKVPELSFQAFGVRQVPQMRIVGSNIPFASRMAVLDQEAKGARSPTPTHVLVVPSLIYANSEMSDKPTRRFPAGTLVTVIERAGRAVRVSKDGKELGFVNTGDLVPMQ